MRESRVSQITSLLPAWEPWGVQARWPRPAVPPRPAIGSEGQGGAGRSADVMDGVKRRGNRFLLSVVRRPQRPVGVLGAAATGSAPVPLPTPFGELGVGGEAGSRGAARPGREQANREQQPSP